MPPGRGSGWPPCTLSPSPSPQCALTVLDMCMGRLCLWARCVSQALLQGMSRTDLACVQVGYGDITPVNALEEMICIALMLIGVIFFGFVISSSQCALPPGWLAPFGDCACPKALTIFQEGSSSNQQPTASGCLPRHPLDAGRGTCL